MRIALLDFLKRDYTVETPRKAPLGGSPSAVCYLAEQFAALGNETWVINFTSSPGKYLGVNQLSWGQIRVEDLDTLNLDAAIVIQAAGRGKAVKAAIGKTGRLVLFGQDATDQPTVWPLHEPAERNSYDGMVMVSQWQADQYGRDFAIDRGRMAVIGNAISPVFERMFADGKPILGSKGGEPWLAYVSVPYRGLEVLLDLFPEIRARVPGARLGVFSSMKVYQGGDDPYQALYERCRATAGVQYFGSVPQPELAARLKGATVLAYPNVYAETACIAVMEAMAAGCAIVTSDLGALPETCAGFARLVPADFQKPENRRRFVDETVAALKEFDGSGKALRRQVDFVNEKYTWAARAREWIPWLQRLEAREPVISAHILGSLHERIRGATAHYQGGRPAEATVICQEILAGHPDHVEAQNLLGVMAFQAGRGEEALRFFDRAVKLNPQRADLQANLGLAMGNFGKKGEALGAFRLAIQLQPDFAEAYQNLAILLAAQKNSDQAIEAMRKYLELRPNDADAWNRLATWFQNENRVDEAIAALRRALDAQPGHVAALYNLGLSLRAQGNWDDAAAVLKRAVEIEPEFVDAHNNRANALKHIGDFEGAELEYRRALELRPGFSEAHSNLIMLLHYAPGKTPKDILDEMRVWNERHARPLANLRKPIEPDRSADRKLRIGYVSPDFSGHIVGLNLLPLFSNHDRERFEIYCYSNVAAPDEFTSKFQSTAAGWRDIRQVDDATAARFVRDDKIDILVDLAGHTANNRLLVFAQKPAPVQVTFGGYPGGTGLETMDWHLTDADLDPQGETESHYVENLYRLRDSFWCYDPQAMVPADELEISELPAKRNGYVTFGCLNNFMKVTESTVRAWAAVVAAVPNSRFLMLAPDGSPRRRISAIFAQAGVAGRVEFVGQQYRRDYLQTYGRIDIGLDTLPYNGHTTSLDAMWMGVPVITAIGQTGVGRAGWSHLSKLSLKELAGQGLGDFPVIAQKLAGDLNGLAELRRGMRKRLDESGLTDGRRFARNIETAYRDIWRQWCQGGT
jgi:protein O-GlcNAc transferase